MVKLPDKIKFADSTGINATILFAVEIYMDKLAEKIGAEREDIVIENMEVNDEGNVTINCKLNRNITDIKIAFVLGENGR